jgi:hypothetical protein
MAEAAQRRRAERSGTSGGEAEREAGDDGRLHKERMPSWLTEALICAACARSARTVAGRRLQGQLSQPVCQPGSQSDSGGRETVRIGESRVTAMRLHSSDCLPSSACFSASVFLPCVSSPSSLPCNHHPLLYAICSSLPVSAANNSARRQHCKPSSLDRQQTTLRQQMRCDQLRGMLDGHPLEAFKKGPPSFGQDALAFRDGTVRAQQLMDDTSIRSSALKLWVEAVGAIRTRGPSDEKTRDKKQGLCEGKWARRRMKTGGGVERRRERTVMLHGAWTSSCQGCPRLLGFWFDRRDDLGRRGHRLAAGRCGRRR